MSVFDHGFNYGDAVFEGIKFLDGRVFDLTGHIDRLFLSANFLQIQVPFDRPALCDQILDVIRANGMRDGYLRVVVSRGSGPLGLRNMDQIREPTLVIICQPARAKTPEELCAAPGKRAKTVSTRRTPPMCLDPRIKSCNYLNNILADLERRAAGSTSPSCSTSTAVCEGPAENIFLTKSAAIRRRCRPRAWTD